MSDRRRGARPTGIALLRWLGRPASSPARLGERGSASILVALWAVVLTLLAAGAAVLGSALAAREAVAAAADLAALAGASATLDEPDRACARASAIARENDAALTECRVEGTEVWVVARVPAPLPVQWLVPGRAGQLRARAHAQLVAEDP